MPAIRGDTVLIKVENPAASGTFVTIAGQRGGTLNLEADELDTSSKDNAGWKGVIVGLKSWSIDCDALLIQTDAALQRLLDAFNARTSVLCQFVRQDGKIFEGNAFISSIPVDAPFDGVSTYSMKFSGDGAPTKFFV